MKKTGKKLLIVMATAMAVQMPVANVFAQENEAAAANEAVLDNEASSAITENTDAAGTKAEAGETQADENSGSTDSVTAAKEDAAVTEGDTSGSKAADKEAVSNESVAADASDEKSESPSTKKSDETRASDKKDSSDQKVLAVTQTVFDNSVNIPDGVYETDATKNLYVSGGGRHAPAIHCEKVRVKDGKATATIVLDSGTYGYVTVEDDFEELNNAENKKNVDAAQNKIAATHPTDSTSAFEMPVKVNEDMSFCGWSDNVSSWISPYVIHIDLDVNNDTDETVEDGTYEVQYKDADSKRFNVIKAVLNVKDGEYTVDLTLNGTGYSHLYQGSASEAEAAGESAWSPYKMDEDGKYYYTIKLPFFNLPFIVASRAARDGAWYDEDREVIIYSKDTNDNELPKKTHVHDLTKVDAKEASCTEDGNIEYYICNKGDNPCNAYFSDAAATNEISLTDTVVKAIGHSYGEWTVTKPATETEEGVETRTCNLCGDTQTRSISKLSPSEISYRNTEGDGTQWVKESKEDAKFVFNRSEDDNVTLNHFKGIQVDNEDVDEANYTAESGSVIVNLKAAYLDTLSTGEHTITALFDDGNNASAKFTIAMKKSEENNEAGETTKTGTTENNSQSGSTQGTTPVKTGKTVTGSVVSSTAVGSKSVAAATPSSGSVVSAGSTGVVTSAPVSVAASKTKSTAKAAPATGDEVSAVWMVSAFAAAAGAVAAVFGLRKRKTDGK